MGPCVHRGAGALLQAPRDPPQAWICLVLSSHFDLERAVSREQLSADPGSGDRGLSHQGPLEIH